MLLLFCLLFGDLGEQPLDRQVRCGSVRLEVGRLDRRLLALANVKKSRYCRRPSSDSAVFSFSMYGTPFCIHSGAGAPFRK